MLHQSDFRNILELTHDWAGFAPDKTDPQNLPRHDRRSAHDPLKHDVRDVLGIPKDDPRYRFFNDAHTVSDQMKIYEGSLFGSR